MWKRQRALNTSPEGSWQPLTEHIFFVVVVVKDKNDLCLNNIYTEQTIPTYFFFLKENLPQTQDSRSNYIWRTHLSSYFLWLPSLNTTLKPIFGSHKMERYVFKKFPTLDVNNHYTRQSLAYSADIKSDLWYSNFLGWHREIPTKKTFWRIVPLFYGLY